MATYFLIGLPFIAAVLVVDIWILKTRVVKKRQTWMVMLVLMIMTAIFDQYLTGRPIVLYDDSLRSGITIGYAPIEDFMYTFAAVIGLGSIMKKFGMLE